MFYNVFSNIYICTESPQELKPARKDIPQLNSSAISNQVFVSDGVNVLQGDPDIPPGQRTVPKLVYSEIPLGCDGNRVASKV